MPDDFENKAEFEAYKQEIDACMNYDEAKKQQLLAELHQTAQNPHAKKHGRKKAMDIPEEELLFTPVYPEMREEPAKRRSIASILETVASIAAVAVILGVLAYYIPLSAGPSSPATGGFDESVGETTMLMTTTTLPPTEPDLNTSFSELINFDKVDAITIVLSDGTSKKVASDHIKDIVQLLKGLKISKEYTIKASGWAFSVQMFQNNELMNTATFLGEGPDNLNTLTYGQYLYTITNKKWIDIEKLFWPYVYEWQSSTTTTDREIYYSTRPVTTTYPTTKSPNGKTSVPSRELDPNRTTKFRGADYFMDLSLEQMRSQIDTLEVYTYYNQPDRGTNSAPQGIISMDTFLDIMKRLKQYKWEYYGWGLNAYELEACHINVIGNNTYYTGIVIGRDEIGRPFGYSSNDLKIVYISETDFSTIDAIFRQFE